MTKCGIFSGAVLAGAVLRALRAVYVWENTFSIVGVAGVAVGHVTTSIMQLWENQCMPSSSA